MHNCNTTRNNHTHTNSSDNNNFLCSILLLHKFHIQEIHYFTYIFCNLLLNNGRVDAYFYTQIWTPLPIVTIMKQHMLKIYDTLVYSKWYNDVIFEWSNYKVCIFYSDVMRHFLMMFTLTHDSFDISKFYIANLHHCFKKHILLVNFTYFLLLLNELASLHQILQVHNHLSFFLSYFHNNIWYKLCNKQNIWYKENILIN